MERIDLFKAYFTQESAYYAQKLEQFNQGKRFTFNFWAGFLGIVWFFYRKMYVQGIIIFFSTFILATFLALVLSLTNPGDTSNNQYNLYITSILSFVILGFLGNNLYIKQSQKIVANFVSKHHLLDHNNLKTNDLRDKGGTSLTAALICFGILIILQIVLKLNA
jgi:hypothetical protein